MIIALTGHRSEDAEPEAVVRRRVREALSRVPEPIEAVICGMANGFDIWAGIEVNSLLIPLWAARPWKSHSPRNGDARLYLDILANAERVVDVSDETTYPGPWIYQKRNEWMVDNATHVMAYWNGTEKGGTFNCVKYARKVNKPIRNIYSHEEERSPRPF